MTRSTTSCFTRLNLDAIALEAIRLSENSSRHSGESRNPGAPRNRERLIAIADQASNSAKVWKTERIPRRRVCPVGNGVQVAFTVPVRKRVKHVWTYWGAISGQLRPALAAQHRLGKRRRRPNPVQAVVRAEARGVA